MRILIHKEDTYTILGEFVTIYRATVILNGFPWTGFGPSIPEAIGRLILTAQAGLNIEVIDEDSI